MQVVIVIQSLALALLALFVVGLLRSHAEILRRLEGFADLGSAAGGELTDQLPPPPVHGVSGKAYPIRGATLDGGATKLKLGVGSPDTLLAFLSSGCLACNEIWADLERVGYALPNGGRVITLTKDTTEESPSRLKRLSRSDAPVIMSSEAWRQYEVPGAPYFIYIEGATGLVHSEGSAMAWEQVLSLLEDAIHDTELAEASARKRRRLGRRGRAKGRRPETPTERDRRADDALTVAGIGPGHPSLDDGPESDGDRGS